jgi:uncharacterized protein YbbC (DUF1343 family)
VLDRPNPRGGEDVDRPRPRPELASMVGLPGLPVRHGLTIGTGRCGRRSPSS